MKESKSGMQKLVEHIGERVQRLEEERLLDAEKSRREYLIKVIAASYDYSSAYTRVVVGVGYAGFFILWVNLKTFMKPWEMVSSGSAILISATIYIMFQVNNMVRVTQDHIKLKKITETPVPEFQKKVDDYNKERDRETIKILSAWRWVLFVTLFFGLAGLGIMLFSFVRFLANA